MVLFYWSLALPHRVGILSAAAVGLIIDLLNGTSVGALTIGLAISNFSILLDYQRIRQFDPLQQSVVIGLLITVALVIEWWLKNILSISEIGANFLYSVPVSVLLWLPIRNMLRAVRRHYRVN